MDGETVEEAETGAVDSGGHDYVGFYGGGETRFYDGDVGGALWVGGETVAGEEVGVEGWGGVGEGAGFVVGVCDGLVGEVGGAGCLLG